MEDPQFTRGFNKYLENVHNNCYMFEVSKCCGYSEIVPIFKTATCSDLHRNVACQFGIKSYNKLKIYTIDTNGKILEIQNYNKLIRDLIFENQSFFKPIYPLPTRVVYKIKYEIDDTLIFCCCNQPSCNSNS
jgi:hypothetical protein